MDNDSLHSVTSDEFKVILAGSLDGFKIVDHAGRITVVNEAYCSLLGYTRDELLGMRISELDANDNQADVMARMERIIRNGSERFESRQWCKDGSIVFLEISVTYSANHGGCFNSFVRDITERKQAETVLKKSEYFFKESQKAASIGSYHTDFIANKWESSDVLDDIFGIDDNYVRDVQGWLAIVHPEDKDLMDRYLIEEVISNRKPFLKEYRILRQNDGEVRWVNGRGSAEFDCDGNILTLMGTIQDITDQKLLEEKLRHSEEKFSTAFYLSPDSININNLINGVYEEVNEGFTAITGYTYDELIGKSSLDIEIWVNPDDRCRLVQELREKGVVNNFEAQFRNKDGSILTGLMSARNIDLGGKACILSITRDITERKRIEQNLMHSHDLMSYIIKFNKSALAVHDKEMKYLFVSERYLEIYKVKDKNIIGKHHYDVFPDLPQKWRDVHKRALEGVISSAENDRYERADGTVEYTCWECRPWYETSGTVGGFIIYSDIVTERLRAEEEKNNLQHQLNQAQKMESIGRLAGGVAHDFNNMLSVILGHAELGLLNTDPSNPVFLDLNEISKAAERSADLTRQLLAFACKQTVAPKVVDLNEAVSGMLKMLRRLIGEDILFNWHPFSTIWQVKIDTSQLDQILANLCVNARDAISGIGKITIETENYSTDESSKNSPFDIIPGEYVKLTVSDNGSGIDKEVLTHIFEPFYTTKELGKGTGLGLATVFGAVKQNNGYIDVHSELGKGTTFAIYLPRYEGKIVKNISYAEKMPLPEGNETILVVEDELAILEIIKLILEQHGYNVLTANTPGEALQLASKNMGDIHLLITDVVMPEMNGRDLAKNLLSIHPDIKRLFMSGYTADIIAHNGVIDEGVNFIQKPFNMNVLTDKVREVLDRN